MLAGWAVTARVHFKKNLSIGPGQSGRMEAGNTEVIWMSLIDFEYLYRSWDNTRPIEQTSCRKPVSKKDAAIRGT
jgi:hypothetical protein